jgi:hypothetical protein
MPTLFGRQSGDNSVDRRSDTQGTAIGPQDGVYTPSDLRFYLTPTLSPEDICSPISHSKSGLLGL